MKYNLRQILSIIFGLPFVILMLVALARAETVGSFIFIGLFEFIFIYISIQFIWRLGIPQSTAINYKQRAIESLNKNICPLCNRNSYSTKQLKIGYRKRIWDEINYRFVYLSYSTSVHEIQTYVNICHSCVKKYSLVSKFKTMSLFMRNPSKKLLKRKSGYLRGLRFPFELWHILNTEKLNNSENSEVKAKEKTSKKSSYINSKSNLLDDLRSIYKHVFLSFIILSFVITLFPPCKWTNKRLEKQNIVNKYYPVKSYSFLFSQTQKDYKYNSWGNTVFMVRQILISELILHYIFASLLSVLVPFAYYKFRQKRINNSQ
ncbi:MAG: hypothetical protein ABIJ40_14460 [Bacteroidota bacterium]